MLQGNEFTLTHLFPYNCLPATTCLYNTSFPPHLVLSDGPIFPTNGWFHKEDNNKPSQGVFVKTSILTKFSSWQILHPLHCL